MSSSLMSTAWCSSNRAKSACHTCNLASAESLERVQESDQRVFLTWGQTPKIIRSIIGFSPVAVDGILKCQRIAVMHKAVSHARAPQRRCPQLGRCFLPTILNDAVSCPDVVQQKVAERMNDLVPECLWHGQSAAVDQRACGSRYNGAQVTYAAANGFKHMRALLSVRCEGRRQ